MDRLVEVDDGVLSNFTAMTLNQGHLYLPTTRKSSAGGFDVIHPARR